MTTEAAVHNNADRRGDKCALLCAAVGADVSLELPTIVVCGQQSAGKSSVVEVRVSVLSRGL